MFFAGRIDRESRALAALVGAAPRGVLTFAIYDDYATPEKAAGFLSRTLPFALHIMEMSASHKALADSIAMLGSQKRCVFVLNTEAAFPDLLAHLNRQAERFRHTPHSLVLWVSESAFEKILQAAPAFAQMRSGLFDFRLKQAAWGPEPVAVNTQICENIDEMRVRAKTYRERIRTTSDPRKLADLHNRLGFALAFLRSYREARQAILRSLELARRIGDRTLEADDLFLLGQVALYSNRLKRAAVLLDASARVSNGAVDAGMDWALSALASRQGDFARAARHAEASVAKCRASGDREGLALALRQLALCHQSENRLEEAEAALREVLTLPRERVGPRDRALAEWNLAEITARRGLVEEAEEQMWRILRQFQDLQDYESLALAWYRLASLAESRNDFAAAVERLEEAGWLWREAGREDYAQRIEAQIEALRRFRNWQAEPAALSA